MTAKYKGVPITVRDNGRLLTEGETKEYVRRAEIMEELMTDTKYNDPMMKRIKDEVEFISKTGDGEPEAAHGREDDLFHDFTRHVAEVGPEPLAGMAKELLKVLELDHPRWYA